ncbi:MAG: dienelactone hydrolase family protein [Crenarchaeota archaeon]|nr:MAG: dienelactone hydrolase family protein [Thermoproteota archaeon]RDJ33924.1 MAG: dienelactone hydrolase family protein [Thermoproteota archaeon]RDJ36964.1 MAG: dienelactone hydrolase family protein [Thermoproteota archaeon]RDJ37501.1 MAG: dienelactone hydrolase family protein [Thermoproteota archaeon]
MIMKSLVLVIALSIIFSAVPLSYSQSIAYFPPPMKQIQDGVLPSSITCTEGLELIFKLSNGSPACVKPSSVVILLERGWGAHSLPDVVPDAIQNSDETKYGEYKVTTSMVNYDEYSGFLAKPTSSESFPGVILIHEWWGLNENIKDTAEKLASYGYVVLAVDLFDGSVATNAQTAMAQVSAFDQEKAIMNMNSAVEYLKTSNDAQMIGSIGWCFGGAQSLNLALENPEVDATVIYYGRLVTDSDSLSVLSAPVLGIFGELDQGIPPSVVNEFESALDSLEVPNDIYIYPNVDHAFANPTGERYAPEEADDAWDKTLEFLESNLKL